MIEFDVWENGSDVKTDRCHWLCFCYCCFFRWWRDVLLFEISLLLFKCLLDSAGLAIFRLASEIELSSTFNSWLNKAITFSHICLRIWNMWTWQIWKKKLRKANSEVNSVQIITVQIKLGLFKAQLLLFSDWWSYKQCLTEIMFWLWEKIFRTYTSPH